MASVTGTLGTAFCCRLERRPETSKSDASSSGQAQVAHVRVWQPWQFSCRPILIFEMDDICVEAPSTVGGRATQQEWTSAGSPWRLTERIASTLDFPRGDFRRASKRPRLYGSSTSQISEHRSLSLKFLARRRCERCAWIRIYPTHSTQTVVMIRLPPRLCRPPAERANADGDYPGKCLLSRPAGGAGSCSSQR